MARRMIEDGTDDTQGNAAKFKGVSDGVDDDTEGNRMYASSDAEIKHDVTPVGDAPEESNDTEGNAARYKGVSDGVEDDTEGNRFSSSDAEIKHDVTPVGNTEDGDDTEGQAFRYGGHAPQVEDDTEGNAAKAGRSVPPAANPGKGIRPKI